MIIRRIQKKPETLLKRVAPYVRVSTNKAEQEESFETQSAVYRNMIENTPEWVLADFYSDKGKTGTSAKHRPGFQQMIADAKSGKLDIILVKSVSRFSRNVGECQRYVDILRANNVTVIFERENIHSDDFTSNFALALIGATAQDESHSISENRRWAYQKQYAEGKYNMGNNRILGYDTGKDGKLIPNGDAWIVREIFDRYLAGDSYSSIARAMSEKAETLRGGGFSVEAIRYIISNEAYVGDKHLMKRPPKDYLTHKINWKASYTDYYLTDDHEGIITREMWDEVQLLRSGRGWDKGIIREGEHHFLYGKLFCGDCGAPFVRRTITARNGSVYKAWNCRERQKGKKGNGCKCRIVKEDELLEELREKLGWEKMDAGQVIDEVSRINVFGDRMEVEMK